MFTVHQGAQTLNQHSTSITTETLAYSSTRLDEVGTRIAAEIDLQSTSHGWSMPLDVAYRAYRYDQTTRDRVLGARPPHPMPSQGRTAVGLTDAPLNLYLVDQQPRIMPSTPLAPALVATDSGKPADLYLFNVVVSLEWQPDEAGQRQLDWAFRNASDFLYDITNGLMAFGQVVFGGPEILPYADIQIMASNRLHGRAWRSGIYQVNKHLPIRLGRGVWRGRGQVTIPWDEPEGYRIIVHEWGHYALDLQDGYLEPTKIQVDHGRPGAADDDTLTLITPGVNQLYESIMQSIDGLSELTYTTPAGGAPARGTASEWEQVRQRYPAMRQTIDLEDAGPGRLPLPLPSFVHLPTPVVSSRPITLFVPAIGAMAEQTGGGQAAAIRDLASALQERPEQCWLYVRQHRSGQPPRLIAQGTLESRSRFQPYPLLGARPGDQLLVVVNGHRRLTSGLTIYAGTLTADSAQALDPRSITQMEFNEPPLVSVLPQAPALEAALETSAQSISRQMVPVVVQVDLPATASPAVVTVKRAWLFAPGAAGIELQRGHGQTSGRRWQSQMANVSSLDGLTLIELSDGRLCLGTYAQGGGPSTHTCNAPIDPGQQNPLTAGSSDGAVMLFFGSVPPETDFSAIKIVTTLVHGTPTSLSVQGLNPLSNVYSLVSNAPLPLNEQDSTLHPTLAITYDGSRARAVGDDALTIGLPRRIYRLNPANGRWEPLPTYLTPQQPFAVTSLNRAAGGATASADTLRSYLDDGQPGFYVVAEG